MHAITICRKEKGETMNLKEHREGVYGRTWREKIEGVNAVIKL